MINNIREIQEKFNEVIAYSQDIENPITDELFEKWAENKKDFIETWGGLTYELPQTILLDRPEEEKEILYKDFIIDTGFYTDASNPIGEFLEAQTQEGFFMNRVITAFEKDGIKIPKGAKISKSLKLFFDNKKVLDLFQTRLSRAIQDCKITGKMVMSVHPLDFLSSSETAHNWHSCHALDGEYRSGNLSYMVDSHTFMFYLRAEKESILPNFPFKWNSKKWRMLCFKDKSNEVFVAGRQYPFSNKKALDVCTEMLREQFKLTDFIDEWEDCKTYANKIMFDSIESLQYNDCLISPSYTPIAFYKKGVDTTFFEGFEDKIMEIGDTIHCLECGQEVLRSSRDMCCSDCGGYIYCDCCGTPAYEEEMYEIDGELLCEFCWDEQIVFCEGCEEPFNSLTTDLCYDEDTLCDYCPECYEELLENRAIKEAVDSDAETRIAFF